MGLSQGDLASRLRDEGVNWAQGTLSKVENGERPVRLSEGPTVADVLGIDLSALIDEGDLLDGLLKQARRDEAAARYALTQAQGQVALATCRHQYLKLMSELTGPHPAEQYVVVGSGPTGFLDVVRQGLRDRGLVLSDLAGDLGLLEDDLAVAAQRRKSLIEGLIGGDRDLLRQVPKQARAVVRGVLEAPRDDNARYVVLDVLLRSYSDADTQGRLPRVRFEPSAPVVNETYVQGLRQESLTQTRDVDAS